MSEKDEELTVQSDLEEDVKEPSNRCGVTPTCKTISMVIGFIVATYIVVNGAVAIKLARMPYSPPVAGGGDDWEECGKPDPPNDATMFSFAGDTYAENDGEFYALDDCEWVGGIIDNSDGDHRRLATSRCQNIGVKWSTWRGLTKVGWHLRFENRGADSLFTSNPTETGSLNTKSLTRDNVELYYKDKNRKMHKKYKESRVCWKVNSSNPGDIGLKMETWRGLGASTVAVSRRATISFPYPNKYFALSDSNSPCITYNSLGIFCSGTEPSGCYNSPSGTTSMCDVRYLYPFASGLNAWMWISKNAPNEN